MDSRFQLVGAVKAEKSKAVGRYKRRLERVKTLTLHTLEASLALTLLLSIYSTPLSLAVDGAVDHSLKLLSILRKPFSVFLLSNAIIVTVAFLSKNNKKTINPPAGRSEFSDIYDEYMSRRRIQSPVPEQAPTNMLQMVPYVPKPVKSAVPVQEKKKHYRRTRSTTTVAAKSRVEAVRPATKEVELRRSVTVNGRSSVNDDMSNEEFNRTVESYIERTRLSLQKELVADLTADDDQDAALVAGRVGSVRSIDCC